MTYLPKLPPVAPRVGQPVSLSNLESEAGTVLPPLQGSMMMGVMPAHRAAVIGAGYSRWLLAVDMAIIPRGVAGPGILEPRDPRVTGSEGPCPARSVSAWHGPATGMMRPARSHCPGDGLLNRSLNL